MQAPTNIIRGKIGLRPVYRKPRKMISQQARPARNPVSRAVDNYIFRRVGHNTFIGKRDNKEKYATAGVLAGGAALGGGAAFLTYKSHGKALKPIAKIPHTKPIGSKVTEEVIPDPIARQRAISLRKIQEHNTTPPEVPNVTTMSDEQYKRSTALGYKQRETAARIARKAKGKQWAADKAANEAEVKPWKKTLVETDPNLNGLSPDASIADVDRVLGTSGKVRKSFVRIGDEIVTRTPAQVKAQGLKIVRHSSLGGVSREDRKIERDLSSSWRTVRDIADGKTVPGSPMRPPEKHTTQKGRAVHHGNTSGMAEMQGMQNFSATASLKPGQSQRHADAIVSLRRSDPPALQEQMRRHELTHVNVRKPMSRDVRQQKHPEKIWGDEARADMAMTPETRRMTVYNWSAKHKRVYPGMQPRYNEGFNRGGGKLYKDVQNKIYRARQQQPEWREPKKMNRKVIYVGGGLAAGGAAGGAGVVAYKDQKKKQL